MNNCKKVENWILNHPNEPKPEWVSAHIKECESCRLKIGVDQLLSHMSPTKENSEKLEFTPEKDWLIRNTIQSVSSEILNRSAPKKKTFHSLRYIIGGAMAFLLVIMAFVYVPFIDQQPMYSIIMNEKMKESIKNKDVIVSTETFGSKEEEKLQFAGFYADTNEGQEFLFSNSESSRNKLLFTKFLSEKSNMSYSDIYKNVSQDQYMKAMKKAGVPAYKTWKQFLKYIETFTLLPGDTHLSIDGMVVSFDYETNTVVIDSFSKPLICDFVTIQRLSPFSLCKFVLKNQNENWTITSIEDLPGSEYVIGKVISFENNQLIIEDFDKSIYVSNRILENLESCDIEKIDEDFLCRVKNIDNNYIALSLCKIQKSVNRSISGSVKYSGKNGFVLESVSMTFATGKDSAILEIGDFVTVQGEDFGSFFIVNDILSIVSSEELNNDLYLASAPSQASQTENSTKNSNPVVSTPDKQSEKVRTPQAPIQYQSDIVVGVNENEYFLLSGKTIYRESVSSSLSIGESLRYSESNGMTNVTDHYSDKANVAQYTVSVLEVLPNGIVILNSLFDNNRIYLYDTLIDVSETFVFQGKVVSYGTINIALEWRTFCLGTLISVKGMITKELEANSLYQLDNGYILKIDDLTEIQGELKIGRIVQISGKSEQSILHGYIVTVEKESVIMQGEIVEIDTINQWFILDNGVVIHFNDSTKYYGDGKLEIGEVVYCNVYTQEGSYIATDIAWEKDAIPGTGEWI